MIQTSVDSVEGALIHALEEVDDSLRQWRDAVSRLVQKMEAVPLGGDEDRSLLKRYQLYQTHGDRLLENRRQLVSQLQSLIPFRNADLFRQYGEADAVYDNY